MAGGKATPKKDKAVKVSDGMLVKTGQILVRGLSTYKAGVHVRGLDTLFALCPGKIYFSHRKTSKGKVRTCVNIAPIAEKTEK